MNFLANLLKGVLISLIGSVIVYVIVFAYLSGKPLKSTKDFKALLNDMIDVKDKISMLKNRSGLVAEQIDVQNKFNDVDQDQKNEIEKTLSMIDQQLKISEDSRNRIDTTDEFAATPTSFTPEDLHSVKKDLHRLQKQLDRIENNNRLLTLQIRLLQKQNEQLILKNKSAHSKN